MVITEHVIAEFRVFKLTVGPYTCRIGVLEMIAWRILANLDTKISLAITPNLKNMNPLVIIFA